MRSRSASLRAFSASFSALRRAASSSRAFFAARRCASRSFWARCRSASFCLRSRSFSRSRWACSRCRSFSRLAFSRSFSRRAFSRSFSRSAFSRSFSRLALSRSFSRSARSRAALSGLAADLLGLAAPRAGLRAGALLRGDAFRGADGARLAPALVVAREGFADPALAVRAAGYCFAVGWPFFLPAVDFVALAFPVPALDLGDLRALALPCGRADEIFFLRAAMV